MSKLRVVSVTPIKLNNQRCPGKNIMPLGSKGKVLCQHLFDTLKDVKSLDDRYVFCSDEEILKYMPSWMTFEKRDPVLDGNTIRGLQIIDAFVEAIDADIYVLCHVTAPFIKAETIQHAIEMMETGDYDSAFTAMAEADYAWYKGVPVNYDMKNIV
ncbi:MAG: acylneuraminate cytidylyltransferase family protein, partial [Lentisphaeria bacterium]|nr:acylneuraminate cytidylyltransferase family protein [Lentisphaeria bacterium]